MRAFSWSTIKATLMKYQPNATKDLRDQSQHESQHWQLLTCQTCESAPHWMTVAWVTCHERNQTRSAAMLSLASLLSLCCRRTNRDNATLNNLDQFTVVSSVRIGKLVNVWRTYGQQFGVLLLTQMYTFHITRACCSVVWRSRQTHNTDYTLRSFKYLPSHSIENWLVFI